MPGADLKIKWPNDLHCGGRKLAGMLTEGKMDADGMKTLVFGIGININSNPMDYPEGLRTQATSLVALHGEELSLNEVSARVLAAIQRAYRCCTTDANHESLAAAWALLDALDGQWVTARIGQNALSGRASGIDNSGPCACARQMAPSTASARGMSPSDRPVSYRPHCNRSTMPKPHPSYPAS